MTHTFSIEHSWLGVNADLYNTIDHEIAIRFKKRLREYFSMHRSLVIGAPGGGGNVVGGEGLTTQMAEFVFTRIGRNVDNEGSDLIQGCVIGPVGDVFHDFGGLGFVLYIPTQGETRERCIYAWRQIQGMWALHDLHGVPSAELRKLLGTMKAALKQ